MSTKDETHLKIFGDIFDRKIEYRNRVKNNKVFKSCRINLYSKSLCLDIMSNGIMPNKTYSDDMTIFEKIPDKYMRYFILGVLDGDGSVFFSKGYPSAEFIGREEFIKKIKEYMVNRLGLKDNKITISKGVYRIRWSSKKCLNILFEFLYKDIKDVPYLKRKKQVFKSKNNKNASRLF